MMRLDELLDYLLALIVVALGWICGLGMFCARAEMKSGLHVTLHGLFCNCGGPGENH